MDRRGRREHHKARRCGQFRLKRLSWNEVRTHAAKFADDWQRVSSGGIRGDGGEVERYKENKYG